MKCPACDRKLTRIKIGPTVLDACQNGCGGVWFDAHELAMVNQAIPASQSPLAEIIRDPALEVDADRVRKCVRCRGVKLERKLFSLGTGVIMDCCPKCAGLWLDHGELDTIREETHPKSKPIRHVVTHIPATRVSINFDMIQQVQVLRIRR